MIPFASQRGNGQDLATHLLNAHDNERIELYQVRRAIARDLHGVFAEWEAIATGLTRARQYLCSLSINPDERQGRLTRAQYLDYIERAETALGLSAQPRAIIFHKKCGEDGIVRQHCHVVWSRTDVKNKRAIPLPFFKEKLMAVTRAFAHDHGLRLPPGYDRDYDDPHPDGQLSAYDCVKQKETGISHEERVAAVTGAWRRSDSAKAFVAALEDLGYVLACGRNKTRVVLVDFYGHTTALTRLIDDASVRAKHVRDFLGPAFAPDRLPSVEQAQYQAAQRRQAVEAFAAAAHDGNEAEQLDRQQRERRKGVDAQAAIFRRQQHDERVQLANLHKTERQRLKVSYLAAQRRIRVERARRRPRGLAAFLGRVSGAALIVRKVQRYRDRRRYTAYLVWRDEVKRRQKKARDALAAQHALQLADIRRSLRALDQIEQRERESLRQARRRRQRQRINARHEHMPAMAPLTTPEKSAPPTAPTALPEPPAARQMAEAARLLKEARQPALPHSAGTEDGDGESGGGTGTAEPTRKRKRKPASRVKTRSSLRLEFGQAASSGEQDEGGGSGENSEAPKAVVEPSRKRRRRRRRKPRDRPDQNRNQGSHDEAQDQQREKEPHRRRRDPNPPK